MEADMRYRFVLVIAILGAASPNAAAFAQSSILAYPVFTHTPNM
jgi:hypothetical protein